MLKDYLKEQKMSAAELGRRIGVSRPSAHRMATGVRFKKIRKLFLDIYNATGGDMTPNDILGIPPKKENGGK